VIAGNKMDIATEDQEILIEDVKEWLEEEHVDSKSLEYLKQLSHCKDISNRLLGPECFQHPECVQHILASRTNQFRRKFQVRFKIIQTLDLV
jgi:hypothetical protein